MWDAIFPYLAAIIPTIGMLTIAWVVFKNVFEADRKERLAMSQWDAAHHPAPAGNDSAGRGGADSADRAVADSVERGPHEPESP